MQSTRTAGLSIIELLMVIAIIGILSTVVLASLNESRAEARDILRISQLKEVEKALVSYYFENNTYPAGNGILSVEATAIAPTQINDLPNDPFFTGTDCAVAGHNYCYAQIDGGEGYVLTASVESAAVDECMIKFGSGTPSFGDKTLCSNI